MERYSEADFFNQSTGDVSVIADYVNHHGPNHLGHFTMSRPVFHARMDSTALTSSSGSFTFASYEGEFEIKPTGSGIAGSTYCFTENVCPPPPTSVVSPFAATCRSEMCSQFPAEIDMASFLAELKDITSLVTSLKDIWDFLKALGKEPGTLRRAANIHAGYNFGVSPLLGDVATIANILTTVRDRLEWLRRNRNRYVRIGASTRYSISEQTSLGGFGFASYSPGVGLVRTAQRGTLTCTARVKQNFPWLDDWEGWVRGVIGTAGFNKPMTTVWELTPFSFIVDYFVPVGEFLSMQSFEDITDWHVKDPSWSSKTSYDFQLPVGFQPNPFEDPVLFAPMGALTLQVYRRSVGLPPWEFYIKTPSAKQLSLLAALAILEE
jgi:hypothetical protein